MIYLYIRYLLGGGVLRRQVGDLITLRGGGGC